MGQKVKWSQLEHWQKKARLVSAIATTRKARAQGLRVALDAAEAAYRNAQYASEILPGVLTGWKARDPGKDGPNYRFIMDSGRAVMASDLLSQEDQTEARKRGVSLVSLAEVVHGLCPKCGPDDQYPIIEKYHQEVDAWDGDIWTKWCLLACPVCCAVYQMAEPESRDHRF